MPKIHFNVRLEFQEHITVPIKSIIKDIIKDKLDQEFDIYHDDMRDGKTLLNLRDDRQIPIINWKPTGSEDHPEIVVKLSEPLDINEYSLDDSVFVSRELLDTVYERIRFTPFSEIIVPQLRPSRDDTKKIGKSVSITATLEELIENIAGGTGALGAGSDYVNYVSNNILESEYNNNIDGFDINVDHSNFENFVTFGSAQKRIDVFKAKLENIESLVKQAPVFIENLNISASIADSGSYDTVFGLLEIDNVGTASLSLAGTLPTDDAINTSINTSLKIQSVIREFDKYEKELWFSENLPYSSSDASYFDAPEQYKSDYTYPKILGIPLATTNVTSSGWYTSMSVIATDYDNNNLNTLSKNVPLYIQEDDFSIDFLTFVDMVGHHFDNIKSYITNIQHLSSRYPKIDGEISGDMARKVLESFGINAPSIASSQKLINYVTGNNENDPYKDIANEYYKRYLHALPFLLRTKGTKQSVHSLLNIFGINPDVITIREGISNRYASLEPKKVTSTEQDFALNVPSGSHLIVPFSASLRSPQTIQARFNLIDDRTQPVFRFDNDYTIQATFHPDGSTNTYYANTGRIDLMSASVALVTSSYFDLFDREFTSIQLKYNAGGAILDIRKIEGEETTFTQSLQETQMSMSADWSGLEELYIGIPPASASGAEYTSASLDEFRMWGQPITQAKFIEFAENPGMYAGNTYTSSLEDLYVRLSFNLPTDVSTDGYIPNTTPYVSKSEALDLTNISGSEFPVASSPLYNTTRYIRTVIYNSYTAGAESETTDMVRIAPEPPATMSLSSTRITTPEIDKFISSSVATNLIDLSISPVDGVDREIIRSFGNIQLGQYLGRKQDENLPSYTLLDGLEDVFVRELAPTIDYNNFIKFFDKFLHLFYESIEQFLPARAKVRKGIVIRPHILDRTKVNNRVNFKFSGETSRRTLNDEKDVIRSFDVNLPAISVKPDEELLSTQVYGLFGNQDSSITIDDWGAEIDATDLTSMNATYNYYESNLRLENTTTVVGDTLPLEVDIVRPNKYQNNIKIIDVQTQPRDIGAAYCDMWGASANSKYARLHEAVTYYDDPYGLYYIDATRDIYITNSYMQANGGPTDRGTWSKNTVYNPGDVVLQPIGTTDSGGNLLSGNGNYYYFRNPVSKESFGPPQLSSEWGRVIKKTEGYQKLARATLVTSSYYEPGKTKYLGLLPGDVNYGLDPIYVTGSLVNEIVVSINEDLAASYTAVPQEYRRHFIKCRDKTLGGLRRTYLGTLNTKATSADGGFPYEIFDSETNTLTVGTPEPCADCD
jgi:hypothetical protein